jgi:catechol 2,3-dioxygenase-like lactoylglutathione lyase family enzyme
MTLKRMDNVLIVVDDLEAAKAFFIELGLKFEGETIVEGPLVGGLIGLKDVRATVAMMRTPDGQGIELDKFHTPDAIRFGPVDAPVNTLGIRRIMFAVDDIGAVVARMLAHGAELIGEMQYGEPTGSPTSAAPRASLSRWRSSSAKVSPGGGETGMPAPGRTGRAPRLPWHFRRTVSSLRHLSASRGWSPRRLQCST